ncbi:MAG TPA: nitroreductase family protein [bacterium]
MTVKETIDKRRAYRSLDSFPVTDELIADLASCAGLFCSCFNNQPWRFVFVYDPAVLEKMHGTLSKGNEWAYDASMIVAAFALKKDDCLIKEREYYLFDTGMAVAAIVLRATELGLVAHPIAGYREDEVRNVLGIPSDARIITLIIMGKHSSELKPVLSEQQKQAEIKRPDRLPMNKFVFKNQYREQA